MVIGGRDEHRPQTEGLEDEPDVGVDAPELDAKRQAAGKPARDEVRGVELRRQVEAQADHVEVSGERARHRGARGGDSRPFARRRHGGRWS